MRDPLPPEARPHRAGEQRVEDAIQLPRAGAAREPSQLPAETDQRHAVAPGEIGRGERRGGAHRRVERSLVRELRLRERVEEQHQVRAVLGMLDVDVWCAAARGRAPVDAADAVARRQRAQIGELDPFASLARNLAAQDRPGAERRDDAAQALDAGVDPYVGRLAQRSVDRRRPEPVARADDRGTDVVHAPAPGRELERQLPPLAAREPEPDRRRVAVEPRGGRQLNVDARAAAAVVDGERRAQPVSFQDAVAVEPSGRPRARAVRRRARSRPAARTASPGPRAARFP